MKEKYFPWSSYFGVAVSSGLAAFWATQSFKNYGLAGLTASVCFGVALLTCWIFSHLMFRWFRRDRRAMHCAVCFEVDLKEGGEYALCQVHFKELLKTWTPRMKGVKREDYSGQVSE